MRHLIALLSFLAFAALDAEDKAIESFPTAADFPAINAAAKLGDATAIVQSGICAREGIGRVRNAEEAFHIFKNAAEAGDSLAMFYLATCYDLGTGTTKNLPEAHTWAQKSADKGNPKGIAFLGFLYTKQDNPKASLAEGFRLASEAAKTRDGYAEAILGSLYSDGIGTAKDPGQAFKLFQSSADKGTRLGWLFLGDAHHFGTGTAINEQKAASSWMKAADQKHPVAFLRLAGAYVEGEGVNQSYDKAKMYAEYALESDADVRPYAAALLARLYMEGLGVDKSAVLAAKYLRQSAAGGHIGSMNNYAALCLMTGSGVLPDRTLAVALYMVAAAKGDEVAKGNLSGITPSESASFSYSKSTAIARSIVQSLETHHEIVELQEGWNSDQLNRAAQGAPKAETGPQQRPDRQILVNFGSGLVFTPEGHVFTNHHVVESGISFEIYIPTLKKKLPAKLVASDAANDLAILKVDSWKDEKHSPSLPPPMVSSNKAKIGDKVFAIGFPLPESLGTEAKYTSGDISSLSGMGDDKRHFQISVPVQPGNSGGPLALADGRIVGVVVSSINSLRVLRESGRIPQNINFAVKSDYLRILAANSGVVVPEDLKVTGDPVDHLNAYTVQIITSK